MDMFFLLKSLSGLLITLAVLIFFLVYRPRKIAEKKKAVPKKKEHYGDDFMTLKDLVLILKNKKSTSQELQSALDLIIKYHGTIHPKLGIRAHPDFNIYAEIVMRICRHPNTNKNLIIKFDKEITAKNIEYKREINDFLTKGLESRGA